MNEVGVAPGERIRILRVIARLNVGGPALHAVLLTERLDPLRYETRLVAGQVGDDEGDYLHLRGLMPPELVILPALGRDLRGRRDVSALVALVREMRRFRPDVVHTHTAKAGALGRIAAAICRVPVVVHTYHGHVFDGYFSPRRTRVFVALERWLARRADALVTVTDRVRRDVLALGIGREDQVVVVPLGLDLEPLTGAAARRGELRRELGVPADTPMVGIMARLVPIKAHQVFLEALARAARSRPDLVGLVIGDGERRVELEALARTLGVADRVRWLGWRADLDRVYADLDVVVLTSRNEGSPVALIEAMAAARPVVSTRAGGVEDVIDHERTGLLAPVDDGDAVARMILRVLDEPALGRALGEAAQRVVLARFPSERLLGDIDTLYTRLLTARGRRPAPLPPVAAH